MFIIYFNSSLINFIARITYVKGKQGQVYFTVNLLHNVYYICVKLETKKDYTSL